MGMRYNFNSVAAFSHAKYSHTEYQNRDRLPLFDCVGHVVMRYICSSLHTAFLVHVVYW